MTTTVETRREYSERPQTKPARKEAKEKERPQLPEGISEAAQRLLAKMEDEGRLLPGEIAQGMYSTLQNGQTLLADGYSVAYAVDPKTLLRIPSRFTVTRPAHKKPLMPLLPDGTREVRQYTVDARIVTNPETGQQEVRVQCDGRCGQAQGWDWCLHCEAIALMAEQSLRLIAHMTRQSAALPVAPIAILPTESPSMCWECNGRFYVKSYLHRAWIPCPNCNEEALIPPTHDDLKHLLPVSAETRRMDWED